MEEKEQPTAEVGTEEVANQPDGEVKAQPTIEELQAEIARKEQVITNTKAELKRLQRVGGSKAETDALSKKLEDFQDTMADWMDDLANKVSGEEVAPPQRQSYKERLQAKRATQPKQELDPAAQRFFDYLTEEGLDFDDEKIQEAIKDTKTPQEAQKAVKEMVKNMHQTEIEELADKKAEAKVQLEVEKALKERGLTTAGAGGPSASANAWRDATPEEKLLMGVEGKK